MFTAPLLTIAKTQKQPKWPSTDEQIEVWYKYTYNGILLSHKKQEIMPFAATSMKLERDYYIKQSKSERERQISYDIIYMWNIKYDTNEHIYESETDSQT